MRSATCAILLQALLMVACGGDTTPQLNQIESFDVLSEVFDPSTESLTVTIRVTAPASDAAVRSLAESLITERRGNHRSITVRTHLSGTGAGDLPYAVSVLQDGATTHRFNKQAIPQKIPTH